MSQDGSDTAVVTADTSNSIPQRSVKNEICIIIGDMVKNGHNMEVVNAFLAHGYNMVILYSNDDKTDEKEIGGWIDKKFSHQIIDISKIDVKSSDAINKVFTQLASKLTSDEWSQCQVTVLIYNAAFGLVKVVSSNNKEDEKKDNEKSSLTLKELAYCHDIAAHGFIHSVKEGLKFFDKKSKSNFHIFYGKPKCNTNSELMKTVDYGTSLISDNIKSDSKKLLHVISQPADGWTYLSLIASDLVEPFNEWANVTLTCVISTTIDTGNASDPNDTTYFLTNETVTIDRKTYFKLSTAESSAWQIGANNAGSTFTRHLALGTTINQESMALTVDSDGHVTQSGVIGSDGNEQWRIEPILAIGIGTSFCQQFRFVNYGRSKTLTCESQQYTPSGTRDPQTVYVASTEDISDSARTWTVSWS